MTIPCRLKVSDRLDDVGAAPVEFVLVAPLVLLLVLATVQLTLALYVRNTLVAAAAESARLAADRGATPAQARALALGVLSHQLAGGVVTGVQVTTVTRGGVRLEQVRLNARLPLVGLLGPTSLAVTGHALAEP